MSVTADSNRATGLATAPKSPLASPYRRLTVAIFVVIFLVAFEAMAVATAMPTAVRDLNGLAFYAWAFSGFLAASMFGMVVAGESADRMGPRRPLLIGSVAFITGMLIAGASPAMLPFVAGRAIQGYGGGMAIVAIYVVIARAYPESLRPKVFALVAAAWVLPSIVGPVVAGAVADQLSWRLVFLGLIPFAVPPLAALWKASAGLEAAEQENGAVRKGRRLLAAIAAVGVALLQLGGQILGWQGLLIAVLAVGMIIPTVPGLLPRGTLRFARGLPTVIAMRGVLAGSFFGAEAFIPLMLIEERALSSTMAGLSLTGAALGWSAGSWFQGRSGLRIPRFRLVPIGSAIVAVSIAALLPALLPGVSAIVAAVAWTVSGVGMGMAMSSLSVLVFELSEPGEQGANAAALQVSDALFSITFVGLGGVLFAAGHDAAAKSNAEVFALIFVVMAVLAGLGTIVGGRVRPTRP